jgi:hypothetical protein
MDVRHAVIPKPMSGAQQLPQTVPGILVTKDIAKSRKGNLPVKAAD